MEYRDYHRMTAQRPLLELFLAGVVAGFLIAAGCSLINFIVLAVQP